MIRLKKSAQRAEYRRTDQWEHLRKGLFRYRDTARQADLSRGSLENNFKEQIRNCIEDMYSGGTTEYMMFRGTGKNRPLIVALKQCPAACAAGLFCFNTFYVQSSIYSLMRSSAICTAFVAAPLRTWSPQHHRFIPFSLTRSRRILPT